MRLAICVCSTRDWKPQFGVALAALVNDIAIRGVAGKALERFDLLVEQNCSNLCNGRHSVIQRAIAGDFTHALLLDDDMTFPTDIADRLASHNCDVVASNASKKAYGSLGVAVGFDNEFISGPGVQEVARAGLAVALIKLSALKNIPMPWFEVLWIPQIGRTVGEDYYFCMKLRKQGVKIFVDQDVSPLIGHVGDFEYRLSDDVFRPNAKRNEKVAGGASGEAS